MIRNVIQHILKAYIFLTLTVLLVSLGSASPFAIQLLQTAAGPMLLLYFIQKWLAPHERQPRFLFFFFFTLLVWLLIQQVALMQHWPFFQTPTLWTNWVPLYSQLLLGVSVYLITQDLFGKRENLTSLITFWIFLSSAAAAFFIYVFYVSGVAVERIVLPRFLGPLSPVAFQPNNLIDLFMPGLFLALSIILYNHRRRLNDADPSRAISNMILYLCFACVLLASMVFTKSRAGIVALFAAIGAYWFFLIFTNRRRKGLLKLMGIIFVFAGLFLVSLGVREVIEELQTIRESLDQEIQTLGTRTLVIGATWRLIQAQGGLGVGLGNLKMGWLLNHSEPFTYFPQVSYNDLLWTWAETGFPGIFIWFLVFAGFLLTGFRMAYVSRSCFVSFIFVAAMASVTGLVAHSLVDNTFYVPALLVLMFLVLGIGGAVRQIEDVETQSGIIVPGTTRKIPLLPAVFLIAVTLGSSWISFNQLRAYMLARKDPPKLENIKAAVELDMIQPYYPLFLSNYFRNEYIETRDEKTFQRALHAIREAIRRDPFEVNAYIARAELFLIRGDLLAIEDSFKHMQERIPDFYYGNLAACAFYINASLQTTDQEHQDRFRALALRYYAKAVELYPALNRGRDLYAWLTPEGRLVFDELLSRHMEQGS